MRVPCPFPSGNTLFLMDPPHKARVRVNQRKASNDVESNVQLQEDDSKSNSFLGPRRILSTVAQLANIIIWFWTNAMNAIEMQKYSVESNSLWNEKDHLLRFIQTWIATCLITSLQLLAGALIGRILLFFLNPKLTWSQVRATHSMQLSSLHMFGSLATNMGFMYGKASVIQVLKLLEPFETLGLSLLFFQEGNFTTGIGSSMILVVGAAMSLLKMQAKKPAPLAVVFAILSGLILSCRNVLQRKHHLTNDAIKELNKLERSLVQFTQLSFYSGISLGIISLLQLVVIRPIFRLPELVIFLWHPLYNVFSMTTLGFVSALTHSLLNAGKRVFSIILAVLWFREGLDSKMIAGLIFVGIGGSWYSYESKRKQEKAENGFHKLVLSLTALFFLSWYQRIVT